MSYTFKINSFSHFTAFKTGLLYIVVSVIVLAFLFYINDDDTYLTERLFGASCILFIGPSLFLHYSYYLENKNLMMRWVNDSLEFYDTKKSIKGVLNNNTIISIDVYASTSFIDFGTPGPLAHSVYHYALIKTKDHEFILTSLLYLDLIDIKFKFREVKVNYHKRIFAWI